MQCVQSALAGGAPMSPKIARRVLEMFANLAPKKQADYGLSAGTRPKMPGVWLDAPDRKIGALGARVRRWVTNHGLALNVNTELRDFDLIVPCGLHGKGVTSLARELGHPVAWDEVAERATRHLARALGRGLVARAEDTP